MCIDAGLSQVQSHIRTIICHMDCFSSTQPVCPQSQLTQSVSKLSITKSTHTSHGSTSDSMTKVSKSVQSQLPLGLKQIFC